MPEKGGQWSRGSWRSKLVPATFCMLRQMAAQSCSRSPDSPMVERPFAYNPYNRSPTESYGVTAIDELPLMAQSLVVTPLWPNGSGASRSLGAPQSRIGVPGGRATTRHPSLQLVKLRKPPGFFRRWHTQKSRASRRSSREHRGRGARHGLRQAAAATAGGKRHAGVIHVDTSCHR